MEEPAVTDPADVTTVAGQVTVSRGFIPYDLLPTRELTADEIADRKPYDGPRSVPEGHVVIDQDYDTNEWRLSEHGGTIVPERLWQEYQVHVRAANRAAESFDDGEHIPGWAQNGLPEPDPQTRTLAMIPIFIPLRNRLSRGSQ